MLLASAAPPPPGSGGTATTARDATRPALGSAQAAAAVVSAVLRARIRALDPQVVLAVGIPAKCSPPSCPASAWSLTRPCSRPQPTRPAGPAGAAGACRKQRCRHHGRGHHRASGRGKGDHRPRRRPAGRPGCHRRALGPRPQRVLAVGSGFGTASQLASRIAVAETGVQLPGGGQVLFPSHLLVALYGHPGTPSLGVLGQQDLKASIARAKQVAAAYRRLSSARVIPALEIIATVARAAPARTASTPMRPRSPRCGHGYSGPPRPGSMSSWTCSPAGPACSPGQDVQVAARTARRGAGPGPGVEAGTGTATAAADRQRKRRKVNSVARWLAALTARYRLPQKLLVLHQFRLSMIQDERRSSTPGMTIWPSSSTWTGRVPRGRWSRPGTPSPRPRPPRVFFGSRGFMSRTIPC